MGNQQSRISPPDFFPSLQLEKKVKSFFGSYGSEKKEYEKRGHSKSFTSKIKSIFSGESDDDDYTLESNLGRPDQRLQVKNNRVHPFIGVGRIKFTLTSTQGPLPGEATGFLITQRHVLTCAHIFGIEKGEQFFQTSRLQYFPEPLSRHEKFDHDTGIKARLLEVRQEFFSSIPLHQRRIHDCAVLELAQNSLIKPEMVLRCNFNYTFDPKKVERDYICIPSYPSKQDFRELESFHKTSFTKALFYHEDQVIKENSKGIIWHQISTTKGASGAPLLLKLPNGSYEAVGLHAAKHGKYNEGLLLKQCSIKEIIQNVIKQNPLKFPSLNDSQHSNPELEELIKKYFRNKKNPQILIEKDKELKILIKESHRMNKLQKLSINEGTCTDEGLKMLAVNGGNFENLRFFYLQKNQISDVGFKAIIRNGQKFEKLQSIHIQETKVTYSSLETLAEHGEKLKNLESLHMAFSKITDKGIKALVEGGDKFKSLQSLNFSYNRITDEGMLALVENGLSLKQLKSLNLSYNLISDKGFKGLIQNGGNLRGLQILNLSGNEITQNGLKAFNESELRGTMMKEMGLQMVDLRHNKISKDARSWLKGQLKSFPFKIHV